MNNISFWDGKEWIALGSGITGGDVKDVVILGREVYVGGDFQVAGGKKSNYFAHWNPLQVLHNGKEYSNMISFCEGEKNELNVPNAYSGYQWYKDNQAITGQTNYYLPVNESGKYSVRILYANGGFSYSNDVNVKINTFPEGLTIQTGKANTVEYNYFCAGDSLEISIPGEYNSYQWEGAGFTGNSQSSSVYATDPGYFRVTVGNFGCETTSEDIQLFNYPEITTPVVKAIEGTNGYILICKEPIGNYSFMWYEDGEEAPEESGKTTKNNLRVYETQQPGNEYYVKVTDANNCSIESEPLIISNKKSLSVYPNPNKGTFTINLTRSSSDLIRFENQENLIRSSSDLVRFKDILGREIPIEIIRSEGNFLEISVPNARTGIYFLEVIDSEGDRFVKKVFVE